MHSMVYVYFGVFFRIYDRVWGVAWCEWWSFWYLRRTIMSPVMIIAFFWQIHYILVSICRIHSVHLVQYGYKLYHVISCYIHYVFTNYLQNCWLNPMGFCVLFFRSARMQPTRASSSPRTFWGQGWSRDGNGTKNVGWDLALGSWI